MKKILSICALSLIGVFALSLIILSFSSKSYNPNLSDPVQIRIFKDGVYKNDDSLICYQESSLDSKNVEIYETIIEKFNNSFTQNLIGALFSGKLNFSVETAYNYNNTSTMTSKFSTSSNIFLEFSYLNDPQTITASTSDGDKINVSYTTLFIQLFEDDSFQEMNIYIDSNEDPYKYASSYSIKTYANTSNLYNYVSTL